VTRPFSACFPVCLAVALLGSPALAARAKDAQAQKALSEAIEKDFLETRFDAAEQRLRGAITACGAEGCTPALKARLHAALGSVLAAGKKQLGDAKDAFVEALGIDPAVKPNPDIASSEADYAFEMAKKELKLPGKAATRPAAPAPEKARLGSAGDACDEEKPCASAYRCKAGRCAVPEDDQPKVQEEPKPKARNNWVTIVFSPDISVFAGEDVCTRKAQRELHFVCLRENSTHYVGQPTLGVGDNVKMGLAPSTLRVILGYERIVASNLGLGARIGFAFNGTSDGGASFLPLHLEGRVAYYFGRDPFVGKGVRPSVFVSGGVAQVDSKIDVEVLEDARACGLDPNDTTSPCERTSPDGVREPRSQTLQATKQAGQGFIGGGFALAVAPVESVQFNVGVRVAATLPVVTTVISPEVGFSLGF
jgi:hypothetical protein